MCLTSSGQVAEMTKRCSPSQTDVIFVAMDAFVRIYVDDLFATGSVAAIVVSLLSLAHVSSELHRQAEDEDEVAQVQDDCFHLAVFHSMVFYSVFFPFMLGVRHSKLIDGKTPCPHHN